MLIQGTGRPTKGYFTPSDRRVPSVTTIIGNCKSENTSKALMHWAWKLGKEGVDYKERQKGAIGSGHLAHEMVERFVRERAQGKSSEEANKISIELARNHNEVTDEEDVNNAVNAFGGFYEWFTMTKAEIVAVEVPLVSVNHSVGGTLDAILKINDKYAIGDWKSSNSLYADYLCQIAAYRVLWEECYPDYPITGGYHLIRFDKEYGDFEHRWFRNLQEEERAFLLMLELYNIMKKVERRVR